MINISDAKITHIACFDVYNSGDAPHFLSRLKGARSYFYKFSFVFHVKDHHTKDVNLKFQLNWSNCLDVVSNFVYCSCLYIFSM